jgi:hypothetical protein
MGVLRAARSEVRRPSSRWGWVAAAVGVVAFAAFVRPAWAYPSSVVFAPTGEALSQGEYSAFAYSQLTFRATDPTNGQHNMQLANTWVGGNVGIVPSVPYGRGFSFGGIEVGANLCSPDITGDTRIMPTFDFKINFLAQEGDYVPAIGAGVIGFSTLPQQAFNMAYLSFTRTLKWRGPSYGDLSLGGGTLLIPASQRYPECLTSGEPCAFRGAPPFGDATNFITILGYASPEWGPFSFAIDQVGGTSMLSSFNLSVNLKLVEGAYASLGASFANDRRTEVTQGYPSDGLFFMISVSSALNQIFASHGAHAVPSEAR